VNDASQQEIDFGVVVWKKRKRKEQQKNKTGKVIF
jgi:hypothetical protein